MLKPVKAMLFVFIIIIMLREVFFFGTFRFRQPLLSGTGLNLAYIIIFISIFLFFVYKLVYLQQPHYIFSLTLDPSACKFLSLNVRGLKNKKKRSSTFAYLKDQKCHFCFLQETYSEPKDEIGWRSEWGEKFCTRMAPTGERASAF